MNGPANITHMDLLDESLFHLLKKVSQVATDIYSQERRKGDMTQRQYALLSCLAQNEGASQTRLVRDTGIDRSTLADLAARLESRGYIRREICTSDRRAKNLYLTPKGRQALHDMTPLMAEVDRRLLAALPPAHRDIFLAAIKRLASHSCDKPAQANMADFEKIRNARRKILHRHLPHADTSAPRKTAKSGR